MTLTWTHTPPPTDIVQTLCYFVKPWFPDMHLIHRYRYFDPKLLPDLFWTWLYKLFFCLKPQMWKLSWTEFKLSFSDSESDLEIWEQTQTWLVLPVLWLRLWLWVQLTELNSVSSARTWLKVFSNDLDLILKEICRINFENNWELRRHDGSKNLTETLN